MFRKNIASLIILAWVCVFFAGCGEEKIVSSDIAPESSATVFESSSEEQTSSMAVISEEESSEEETSTSSKKTALRDEYIASATTSSEIKKYTKKDNLMLGSFHFSPTWCDSFGSDEKSRMREFREVVEQGYFNTFLLPTDKYLVEATRIVAENGGTVWLGAGKFNSEKNTIENYTKNIKAKLDALEKEGLRDVVLGFYWDEPIWHGQKNGDFLAQSKVNYTVFGLRNFPVFATGEFSKLEGNEANLGGVTADQMRKLDPACAIYITDAAYDSYSVDVRDGASNGGPNQFAKWQKNVSDKVVDGKSYYTEYKNLLKKHIGHEVNYWYYPTAYFCHLYGGLGGITYSDEDYCIAHLEFMAEDIMKDEHPGGLIIYTYYTFSDSTGFHKRMDLADSFGNYKIYHDYEKWEKYSDALRNTTAKFNSIKTNPITNLGI